MDVKALVPLPQILAWSLLSKTRYSGEQLVVVAGVSDIRIPVPDMVEFWILETEPLNRHERVPKAIVMANMRVELLEKLFVVENRDAAQLSRNGVQDVSI